MTVVPTDQVPRVLMGLVRNVKVWGPKSLFGYLGPGTATCIRVLDCFIHVAEVGQSVEFCVLAETSDGGETCWTGAVATMSLRRREDEGSIILSTEQQVDTLRLYAASENL